MKGYTRLDRAAGNLTEARKCRDNIVAALKRATENLNKAWVDYDKEYDKREARYNKGEVK